MTKQELLTLKKLDQLHAERNLCTPMVLNGKCCACGIDVQVAIHRTLDGYGINGGMVFALDEGELSIKCLQCFKNEKTPPR